MMTRRDAAIALQIPLEMAKRHGIPSRLSEKEFAALNANPPAWLVQSRANRKVGGRPVWTELTCEVCGFVEYERTKKWWPAFDFVHCADHCPAQLPTLDAGKIRAEYPNISARMYGIVDEPR